MKKRKNILELNEKEIIRLYLSEEKSIEDIRKIFNVSYSTIKLRLTRNNIKLRTHSETKKICMNKEEVKEKVSKSSKRSFKKRAKTNLKKYGTIVPACNKKIKEKWENNYLKEHGVQWNKDPERSKKINATCLQRYGVDNVSKVKEVKEKISQKRWKGKSQEELKNIQKKTIATWKKTLKVDNPLKNIEIKRKVINSRWKVKTKQELDIIEEKGKETYRNNIKEKIIPKLANYKIELTSDYKNQIDYVKVKCLKCNTIFETVLDYILHGYELCPTCYPKNSSIWELEVREFIISLIGKENILTTSRNILSSKKEIDIYIPKYSVAIECNGLYWHNEKNIINPNYHLNKTLECRKQNIRLIHIFEDEWILKKDIVKSRIKNILGIKNSHVIYARKCYIKEISPSDKNKFLEQFHIQGKDNSSIKLGAFYNNELVSVMTFSKGNISKGSRTKDGVWELNRFCSNINYHIPGIASKLLKYFQRNYEWKKIFSYADRRWSDGNLYYKLGFNLDHVTQPNYWYTKGSIRIHRFNLRKKPDEPKDIPEWVLRLNEGYIRIWDCGNLKFSIKK